MSNALARLRYVLKDDLFVSTSKGMVSTPRTEQLALPIRQAPLRAVMSKLMPIIRVGSSFFLRPRGRGRAGSPAPTRLSATVAGLAPATDSLLNHLELLGDLV